MDVGVRGHENVGELAGLLVGIFGGLFFDRIKDDIGDSGNMRISEIDFLHEP